MSQSVPSGQQAETADVIVVGAGPAGSAAAYHLANAGLDVLLLEKTAFPREKVCGDGLTPRGTKQLINMGLDISEEAGWIRNYGLRIQGAGHQLQLDWPDLSSHPNYGLTRNRMDFDDMLARQAVKAGARLRERTNVGAPILDERGHIVGVTAKPVDDNGRRAGADVEFRAPLVMAADGNSSRLSIAMGLHKRDDRPMGVAVRTYFTSPRTNDDYLESWLELWADDPKQPGGKVLLPGYGWIFGMGDGTVNVGLGILNTSDAFGKVDYADLLKQWLKVTPDEWQFRDEYQTIPIRGAALPMGFNRQPHYTRGLMLLGDAGGMVNPFNGEGIPYAMESGSFAAEVAAQALRRQPNQRERALSAYPKALKQEYGGYYTLGRIFVKLIGNPEVMRLCTKYGLPRTTLMKFTLKLLANLTDPRDGDVMDKIINGLTKLAPAA
ncbi:geranylgeranyl reductase family protein [Kribbella hippodromi]